jgi:hypothetical protein
LVIHLDLIKIELDGGDVSSVADFQRQVG